MTAAEMEQSLERALRGLGRDYIDIFMLHEQESSLTLRGHGGALDYLVRAKERGLVRAVGMSTPVSYTHLSSRLTRLARWPAIRSCTTAWS